MTLHAFPITLAMEARLPELITGTPDGQLEVALMISDRVFSGERVSLQAMCCAREVIDSRTKAKATVALLGQFIEARREEIRAEAAAHSRRGTIRGELVGVVGFAVVVAVAVGALAL